MYIDFWLKVRLAVLVSFLSLGSLRAQKQSYPKGYYQFPIRPGLSNSLAGGLGDLRSNHFHAGLDIRTQQVEGLPVYAAADGYVLKVAVQRGGYGNVIFLRHPNGQTTVYGHLQKFTGALGDYVRAEQYKSQQSELDLFPEADKFSYKKGQLIALSGNTGGSAGPHLHFEIRDSKDNYVNPLFFGFNEIKDVTPPKFVSMAVRPMDLNARVNGFFARRQYEPVRLKDGTWRLPDTLTATGMIGIDLKAFDQMTGTGFRYGLQCIEIRMDGQEVFSYNMEIFPIAATRDYNNLIDYEKEQETGQRFLRCYVPDGNKFDLYRTNAYQGKLFINDTLTHQVKIRISDSYENFSELIFDIKGEVNIVNNFASEKKQNPGIVRADILENIYKVKAAGFYDPDPSATFFASGKEIKVKTLGYQGGEAVFVSDLRNFIPDSVRIGTVMTKTYLQKLLVPEIPQSFVADKWSIETDSSSLFDTLYVTGKTSFTSLTVNDAAVALKDYVNLTFTPDKLPLIKERSHMYRYANGEYIFTGGAWDNKQIRFRARELGTFYMQTDTVGPKVRLTENSPTRITGFISDYMSGIDKFSARINGQWILLNYDYKRGYIWSEKLDNSIPFEGELTVEVVDRAGNNTILRTDIVEKKVTPKKRRRK